VASTPVRYQSPDEDSARWLGITVPGPAWLALVQAATFDSMKASADNFVPTAGMLTWLHSPRAGPVPAGPGKEDGPAEGDHDRPLP
jgi:hypothetical protein